MTGKTYTAFEARYAMPRHSPAQFSAITVNSAAFGILSPARTQAKYKCGGSVFNSGYDYGNSFYSFNAGNLPSNSSSAILCIPNISSLMSLSFIIGLAHIIFMNAYTNYEAGSNQYVWLVNDLMAVDRTKTPWIIVNFHTPWYVCHFKK